MDRTFKHRRLNTVIWVILLLENMVKVDGGIRISPSVPEMGAVGDAVFTCDSSGLQFVSINSMQISRKRATETEFTLLASIFRTAVAPGISPNVPFLNSGTDLTTRDGVSVSGSGIQTDTTQVSSLKLKIKQVNLLCTDEAEYGCKVVYYSPAPVLSIQTDTSHTKLTIFVPPKYLTLTVTHNGVQPDGGQSTNPTEFSVEDVIQVFCFGNIGSNPNQEFKWQRTPLSGSPPFNPYNPEAGSENKGTVPTTPVNWGSRMTTPTDSTVSCVSEVDRLKTTALIIGVVAAVIIAGLTVVVVVLLTRNNTSGQENSDTRGTELSNYEDLGQRTPADYDVLKLPAAPEPAARHKWNCLCP